MSTAGHPFFINTIQVLELQMHTLLERNGAVSGRITFTVPMNAPNTLYYNCQFHGL
jgi:hypothetical protein